MKTFHIKYLVFVNRRTGGLEISAFNQLTWLNVNRRIGGLENTYSTTIAHYAVNRRTGGLEKRTKFVR